MRILLVDDDDIVLELLSHTLEAEGYDVVTTSSGDEAIRLLDLQDIRCVITDWEMPGTNGLDLCRFVRRTDPDGYVYIIMLTSNGSTDDVVAGLSAGADDFVRKPFDPKELVCRVRVGARILSLETRDVAIFALAKLAESRDNDTGQHLERVRRYSELIARQLSTHPAYGRLVDDTFVRLIYLTSPLHDIGKVGIPDSVLLKPGRLSDDEFALMKTHAEIGAETLRAALDRHPEAEFLRMAHDIAATHHERWDGRGYPAQLAGEDIPLCGRIVAVADVYDALTSRRVYKDAYTHAVACSMIGQESGSHFDPVVVEAFEAVSDRFAEIRRRFSEVPSPASVPESNVPVLV